MYCFRMQSFLRLLYMSFQVKSPANVKEFAPKPLASGSWGLRPQTPQTAPPIANFWLRACLPPHTRFSCSVRLNNGF